MADHVTLMQIDCSVVNTSLVKLKSKALPESLRKRVDNDVKSTKLGSKHNKLNNDIKKSIKDSLDAKLSDPLKNSSKNFSNYSVSKKQIETKDNDIPKDDSFAQYLFSKYEESKQETGDTGNKIKVLNEKVETISVMGIK